MWNSYRSSPPEVFLEKGCLKICSKFTGEHPCRIVISIELLCYFIQVALRHGCSHRNFCIFSEHIFLKTHIEGYFCSYEDLRSIIYNRFIMQLWYQHLAAIVEITQISFRTMRISFKTLFSKKALTWRFLKPQCNDKLL